MKSCDTCGQPCDGKHDCPAWIENLPELVHDIRWAVEQMNADRRVRRPGWEGDTYWYLSENLFVRTGPNNKSPTLNAENMLATDYELADEPAQPDTDVLCPNCRSILYAKGLKVVEDDRLTQDEIDALDIPIGYESAQPADRKCGECKHLKARMTDYCGLCKVIRIHRESVACKDFEANE